MQLLCNIFQLGRVSKIGIFGPLLALPLILALSYLSTNGLASGRLAAGRGESNKQPVAASADTSPLVTPSSTPPSGRGSFSQRQRGGGRVSPFFQLVGGERCTELGAAPSPRLPGGSGSSTGDLSARRSISRTDSFNSDLSSGPSIKSPSSGVSSEPSPKIFSPESPAAGPLPDGKAAAGGPPSLPGSADPSPQQPRIRRKLSQLPASPEVLSGAGQPNQEPVRVGGGLGKPDVKIDPNLEANPQTDVAETPTPANPQILPGLEVLLVDDTEIPRNILGKGFAKRGFKVSEAKNGAEGVSGALQAFSKSVKPFARLIIMDQEMPELMGDQATLQIRQAGFDGIILGFSGAVNQSATRLLFQEAGADGYFSKGELARVIPHIKTCIQKAQSREQLIEYLRAHSDFGKYFFEPGVTKQ